MSKLLNLKHLEVSLTWEASQMYPNDTIYAMNQHKMPAFIITSSLKLDSMNKKIFRQYEVEGVNRFTAHKFFETLEDAQAYCLQIEKQHV